MKIYILPVPDLLQPKEQSHSYPEHNRDYGVEQDFLLYLHKNPDMIVNSPGIADWHYLPIYWTRWHLNHNYAQMRLPELQALTDKIVIDPSRTFTVCQYDDGPVINLHGTKQFLASRKTKIGIDIPLLSSPHHIPIWKPRKVYIASFMGRYSTHPLRGVMSRILENESGYYLFDGDEGSKKYVNIMLSSYIALCPRGYGGSSFRFYEAMQLGIVPFLVGDIDLRPFKNEINWDEFSFYTSDPTQIDSMIRKVSERRLMEMGKIAKKIWGEQLTYQKWCNLALKALE